jgi:hypothetical protein
MKKQKANKRDTDQTGYYWNYNDDNSLIYATLELINHEANQIYYKNSHATEWKYQK